MLDLLELVYGRYNGGSVVPIGTYLNPRTFCLFQTTTDGTLPLDGTFCRVDPSGTQTFANVANTLNQLLNTTYTSTSFHACSGGDAAPSAGSGSDDA